jgi:hypothetical protein
MRSARSARHWRCQIRRRLARLGRGAWQIPLVGAAHLGFGMIGLPTESAAEVRCWAADLRSAGVPRCVCELPMDLRAE